MLDKLVDIFFGCPHRHCTFPITMRSPETGKRTGTYVGCLDCGEELAYDWGRMKLTAGRPRTVPSSALPQVHAHVPGETSITRGKRFRKGGAL